MILTPNAEHNVFLKYKNVNRNLSDHSCRIIHLSAAVCTLNAVQNWCCHFIPHPQASHARVHVCQGTYLLHSHWAGESLCHGVLLLLLFLITPDNDLARMKVFMTILIKKNESPTSKIWDIGVVYRGKNNFVTSAEMVINNWIINHQSSHPENIPSVLQDSAVVKLRAIDLDTQDGCTAQLKRQQGLLPTETTREWQ